MRRAGPPHDGRLRRGRAERAPRPWHAPARLLVLALGLGVGAGPAWAADPRPGQSATRLPDGTVLVVGGLEADGTVGGSS